MKVNTKEVALFGMLGALMYLSKILMEAFPNVHLLGVFTISITVVYRCKALYPIYVYVFLNGLMAGFNMWWIPYLYIWTILWGMTMLLPKKMPMKIKPVVYMTLCGIHGFLFGILYAPAEAVMRGYDFDTMVKWIIAGIPYDLIHGVANFCCGLLIVPIIIALNKMKKLEI